MIVFEILSYHCVSPVCMGGTAGLEGSTWIGICELCFAMKRVRGNGGMGG